MRGAKIFARDRDEACGIAVRERDSAVALVEGLRAELEKAEVELAAMKLRGSGNAMKALMAMQERK